MPGQVMRLCWLAVLLLVFSCGPLAARDLDEHFRLRELLVQESFDELEAILTEAQEGFEAGTVPEARVRFLFGAFITSDPALAEPLDHWNELHPQSYAALLARAYYSLHNGSTARGGKPHRETPKARIELMKQHYTRAAQNAFEAIEVNEKLSLAYGILIGMDSLMSGSWAERVMQAGLKAVPSSFFIRWSYLQTLQPWWGGSMKEIRRFIDTHVRTALNQEDMKSLYGYPDFVAGELLRRNGQKEESIPSFDRAVDSGDDAWYFNRRAWTYRTIKRYDEALRDFNRALELEPYRSDTLDDRAHLLYWRLKDPEAAYADWALAIRLDPLDPDTLFERAKALIKDQRYDEAAVDLDAAAEYGGGDHRIQELRGRNLIYDLKRYRPGAEAMKVATELEPDNANDWYHYAYALDHLRDCDVVPAFERFIEICEVTQTCGSEYLDYARAVSKGLVDQGKCPRQ